MSEWAGLGREGMHLAAQKGRTERGGGNAAGGLRQARIGCEGTRSEMASQLE